MNLIEDERNATKRRKELKNKKTVKRQIFQEEETDVESIENFSSHSTDDLSCDQIDDDTDYPTVLTPDSFTPLTQKPAEGQYVLVAFATKKQVVYFVGKVIESKNEKEEYYISFLRMKSKDCDNSTCLRLKIDLLLKKRILNVFFQAPRLAAEQFDDNLIANLMFLSMHLICVRLWRRS